MNIAPVVINRQKMATWASPSAFTFDGGSASNCGEYIDVSNCLFATNYSVFNAGEPMTLTAKLSGVTVFEGQFRFQEKRILLGDISPFFQGFPLAKGSYWELTLSNVTSHNDDSIRFEFAVVGIENEAAYLEQHIKPIPESKFHVDARIGNLVM